MGGREPSRCYASVCPFPVQKVPGLGWRGPTCRHFIHNLLLVGFSLPWEAGVWLQNKS